jgi:Tfp pilus assembly protein FimT
MLDCKTQKNGGGFSLIELMLVVAVIMVLAAISVPRLIITISDISLRYSAGDLSGLLQSARIQAVRKNTFYSVVPGTLPAGTPVYFLDVNKTGTYANGEPMLPLSRSVTVHQGSGSGAPGETAFLASLSFTVDATGAPPSFNARGLPCIATAISCPMVSGKGFVVFLSKAAIMGNIPWTAVVINPSGHIQLWSSGLNGNWIQRD